MAEPRELVPSSAEGVGAVLLPYQREAVASDAQVNVWEKSRRIGASWCLGELAAETSASQVDAGGDDTLYIGYNLDMAREFIDACAFWAGHLATFAGEAPDVREFIFDDFDPVKGDSRQIKAFRIDFASGYSVIALSSRPRSLRGRQGLVIIDEAAFHDDLPGLLKAAFALLMWGGRVWVLSTHDGADNPFNELVEDVRSGKLPYRLFRTTFDDAVEQGLYDRIKLVLASRGKDVPSKDEWVASIRAFYGDDAAEELDVVPSQGGGAWLPWELILAAEHADAGDPKRYLGGPCYVGMDIAIRRDLVIIWVDELVGDVPWTREVIKMKKATFAEQDAELASVFRRYKVARLCMDQTGIGEKPVEDAKAKYGHYRVEGVLFTSSSKHHLATITKQAYEDRRLRTPKDPTIRDAHRAVKKTVTAAGNPRFDAERTEAGHADEFWGHALALHAAEDVGKGRWQPLNAAGGGDVAAPEDGFMPA